MTVTLNGTNGLTFNDGSSQATAATGFGFKNRIINGDMRIDQRNAGASVTASAVSTITYTLDRWAYYATQASKFTVQRNAGSVTPPAGFTNYLGITSSTATTVGAGDIFLIRQCIEGLNAADLAWGSSSASAVTLSFLVRSSLTGTFSGSLTNDAANRGYAFTFTINNANTWEQKNITIAGDTTGTWRTDNGAGIYVGFSLGTGSTYSGAANTWVGTGYINGNSSAINVVGTNGATFYITGVQLEKGSTATAFDYRDYGRELQMCQRYYEVGSIFYQTGNTTAGSAGYTQQFSVPKRAASTNAFSNITYSGSASGLTDYSANLKSPTGTAGLAFYVVAGTGGFVNFSWSAAAEL